MKRRYFKYSLMFLLFVVSALTLFAEHIIFFEDFNAAPTIPAGWTNEQLEPSRPASKVWSFNNPRGREPGTGFTGNFAIYEGTLGGYFYLPNCQVSLTTPKIDCSGYSDVTLSFDSRYYIDSGYYVNVSLQVSTDGLTWNTIEEYGKSSHGPTLKTYDISAYAAGEKNVQIRWYWDALSQWWAIDNVKLASINPPTLPVELSSFTVNQFVNDGVLLKWTTESETNFLGYNIYRSEDIVIDEAIKINDAIITGTNTSFRANYTYEDKTVEIGKEYFYWLESVNLDLTNEFHGPISIRIEDLTDNGKAVIAQPITKLIGAYPNPFNPTTSISFSLEEKAKVSLDVYNSNGQLIESVIVDKAYPKGVHSITWNGGSDLASGVYFINLNTNGDLTQKKMLLLK
ncbi:MAG: T9SS type A sorting domain-containing protein [Candidatus Cloacimonadia bacterium]